LEPFLRLIKSTVSIAKQTVVWDVQLKQRTNVFLVKTVLTFMKVFVNLCAPQISKWTTLATAARFRHSWISDSFISLSLLPLVFGP
jgi:hypothetical protein